MSLDQTISTSGNLAQYRTQINDLAEGQARPTITGYTGGTSTDLDGITTSGVTVGLVVMTLVSSELGFYALAAGTDAESSPDVIRPDDYAASTNEKVWRRIL